MTLRYINRAFYCMLFFGQIYCYSTYHSFIANMVQLIIVVRDHTFASHITQKRKKMLCLKFSSLRFLVHLAYYSHIYKHL